MLLDNIQISELLKEGKLIIKPLLDQKQIGQITIDLRLGYDFLVSVQGREAFINASRNIKSSKAISSFFQETRRNIGDTFLLHPNQTVLTTSLEYLKIPKNTVAFLKLRSSYSRLGLNLSTLVQPGYCGCVSLELTNINSIPINLTVGAPIFQMYLESINEEKNYFHSKRKYMCQVRPMVSAVRDDEDLEILNKIYETDFL